MPSILLLNCVLTMWLYVTTAAITVSIDRADVKIPPTRSSMIANGWRPLTNSYEETIGTNVSPSSHLKKNVQVHPVLSKFQEHMATSEKLKVRGSNGSFRKGEPIREYNPPSILGSFTVFGHAATKARGETKTPGKHASETREYTFLIPPPKDAYRFELNQHRKPVLRDGVNFLRPAASVYQQPASDPVRAATYFIKGYTSTTNPSTHLANNRPYVPPYAMPQALQPPRQVAAKPFESLKVTSNNNNAKPFFQPPGADIPGDFGKQKIGDRDSYDSRLQPQSHNAQVLHSASSGNFYSQVNHPSSQSFKSTYERDPAFLVHESHEVSYVTPPGTYSAYNFRPSLPYENLLPPALYTPSTPATPTAAVTRNPVNKYGQTDDVERDFKRTELNTRGKQDKANRQTELPNSRTTSTYYVSEQPDLTPPTWPKSKYTSDINEVLPRENPPSKFSQETIVNQNQITQIPKIVYQRPQSSFEPVEVYRPTSVPDYETPESISLKHFNEQQFLLQQQLLQRDRERLAEQERQQKLELERQQQEELKKRQEELNELLQREKEEEDAARLAAESAKNQSQEIVKISSEIPYTIQLGQYEPQVTTDVNILVPADVGIYNLEQLKLQPQIPQAPEGPVNQNYHQYQQRYPNEYQEQQVDYREPQTETRPYRPQKPLRDPYRRKKPTTVTYDTPTEPPSQLPETSIPLTLHGEEVPIQTTEAPETQTLPATQRPRTRRPGAPGRRRKPTTTTEEPVTVSYADEDFLKYRGDEQSSQYDPSRRRRVKPSQMNYNEDAEKRGNTRKRLNYRMRVNQEDSYDAQILTESAPTSYGQTTEPAVNYDENNQFATNQPSVSSQAGEQYATNPSINQYYDYSSQQSEKQREEQRENHRENTTAPVQVEYFTEISRDKAESGHNENGRQEDVNIVTAIPLEELYVKTDGNYYDRATTLASTTTTTTTAAPATTTQAVSSTPRSHKINRPLRYGNTTRPRFSIKDYKSRMDYKSRLSQGSTTEVAPTPVGEALTRNPHTKQRTSQSASKSQPIQQQSADTVRETTGRYKYVSRVNYRTTTTSSPKDHERLSEEGVGSTTEKSNRFVPKRRPISSNVYRSRIATTTTSPTRSQINGETNFSVQRQSSARPENVYSSSIRRRPVMKSRLQTNKEHFVTTYPESKRQEEPTEMAAEETSFYSTMTTAASSSSTARLVGNEIVSGKIDASSHDKQPVKFSAQESKNAHEIEITSQDEESKATIDLEQISNGEEKTEISAIGGNVDAPEGQPEAGETTTKLDTYNDEEELFAKASQSVADLTSSASALYDKPGMYKAVSPESRHVSSHFKIATDEPTLPIEAFFQELSKKNSD